MNLLWQIVCVIGHIFIVLNGQKLSKNLVTLTKRDILANLVLMFSVGRMGLYNLRSMFFKQSGRGCGGLIQVTNIRYLRAALYLEEGDDGSC